jgi:hypothetical protein
MNRSCPKCGDPATHEEGGVAYCDFHPTPLEKLEEAQGSLATDDLDGADIIGVLLTVAPYLEMDLLELIDHELGIELIGASQSNPDRATAIIREWAELEHAISQIA